MPERPHLASLLVALVTVSAVTPAGFGPEWNVPVRQWRNGPVRYILTHREDQAFKRLKTDEERAAFVEAFWKRRDPDPETTANEFFDEFRDRVDRTRSLRMYLESTRPMWMTEPGMYYILLGPPISEDRSQMDTSTRDTLTWTWDQVPGAQQHHFSITFVADGSGEFRASQTPAYDQSTTQGLSPHTPGDLMGPLTGGLGAALQGAAQGGPSNQAALQTALEGAGAGSLWSDPVLEATGQSAGGSTLGRLVDLLRAQPAEEREATAEVRSTLSFDPLPVDVRTDYYRAADGTTYTAFTLGAGADPGGVDPSALVPFGGIVSLEDSMITYPLDREDQFAAAGSDAPGTFQTGLGIDPGRYRVLFGLEDPKSGRVGVWKEDVTVPDLARAGLELSSITLAREVRPLDETERPDSPLKVPYVLGGLRVVPRPDPTLHNGDEFHLYYQVYGAPAGPAGPPVLDIAYQFEGLAGEEWIAIGNPIEQNGQNGQVQAWSFPLQGWPPGEFRVSVRVTDRASGRSAGGALQFAVVD